jgi:hypothetical protein
VELKEVCFPVVVLQIHHSGRRGKLSFINRLLALVAIVAGVLLVGGVTPSISASAETSGQTSITSTAAVHKVAVSLIPSGVSFQSYLTAGSSGPPECGVYAQNVNNLDDFVTGTGVTSCNRPYYSMRLMIIIQKQCIHHLTWCNVAHASKTVLAGGPKAFDLVAKKRCSNDDPTTYRLLAIGKIVLRHPVIEEDGTVQSKIWRRYYCGT